MESFDRARKEGKGVKFFRVEGRGGGGRRAQDRLYWREEKAGGRKGNDPSFLVCPKTELPVCLTTFFQ